MEGSLSHGWLLGSCIPDHPRQLPTSSMGVRDLPCSLQWPLEGLPAAGPWQVSAGSLGVGSREADICSVFLLLDKLNQLNRPHRGGWEPSEQEGGGEQSQGGVSPARVQGEEASRTCPFLCCLGTGTLCADHSEGGRGMGQKQMSQPREAEASYRGLTWWKLWDRCLHPLCHAETHFSIQDAGTLSFSATCPTALWGPSSLTPKPPFKGILLLPHGGLRKLGGATQERRLPREAGEARGGKRKQTAEVIARAPVIHLERKHPNGPNQSDLGAGCSATQLTQGWPLLRSPAAAGATFHPSCAQFLDSGKDARATHSDAPPQRPGTWWQRLGLLQGFGESVLAPSPAATLATGTVLIMCHSSDLTVVLDSQTTSVP